MKAAADAEDPEMARTSHSLKLPRVNTAAPQAHQNFQTLSMDTKASPSRRQLSARKSPTSFMNKRRNSAVAKRSAAKTHDPARRRSAGSPGPRHATHVPGSPQARKRVAKGDTHTTMGRLLQPVDTGELFAGMRSGRKSASPQHKGASATAKPVAGAGFGAGAGSRL